MKRQLTEIAIRNLPHPASGSTKHFDPSLPGFGIRCTARSKSFIVMYGKERRLKTLGRWPDMPLREARRQAKLVAATSTPKHPATRDFEALRGMFLTDCETRLRTTTTDRYRYALKGLEDWPKTVYDPNTLKALKALANWCIDRELLDRNPYARRKVIFGQRDRLLSDEEIAALWQYDHPPYSTLVKLLILTGQRRNQIARYETSWLAPDGITFPASVMKSKRRHIIPATARVTSLLQPFQIAGWSKHKKRIDQHTAVTGWVLHDIRRYFSTTMARLGVPLHITEQILDHRSTVTGVAAIYNLHTYLPEMRAAFERYEAHLAQHIDLPPLPPAD